MPFLTSAAGSTPLDKIERLRDLVKRAVHDLEAPLAVAV
jgi:hypothetical protein